MRRGLIWSRKRELKARHKYMSRLTNPYFWSRKRELKALNMLKPTRPATTPLISQERIESCPDVFVFVRRSYSLLISQERIESARRTERQNNHHNLISQERIESLSSFEPSSAAIRSTDLARENWKYRITSEDVYKSNWSRKRELKVLYPKPLKLLKIHWSRKRELKVGQRQAANVIQGVLISQERIERFLLSQIVLYRIVKETDLARENWKLGAGLRRRSNAKRRWSRKRELKEHSHPPSTITSNINWSRKRELKA